MGKVSHKRHRYASDLTMRQWCYLQALLPSRKAAVGRPMTLAMREVLNAIFYLLRTRCQWTNLPNDYPNCKSVY